MLGYGRAVIATIVLATRVLGSELKAAQLVTSDSKTLPKRMRKIFQPFICILLGSVTYCCWKA